MLHSVKSATMSSTKTLLFLLSTLLAVSLCQSQGDMLRGPLLAGTTVFSVVTSTTTTTKATPCFVAEESLSTCRRKRGMQERPEIRLLKPIAPTFVKSIEVSKEPTFLPIGKTFNSYQTELVQSSFDDYQRSALPYLSQIGARSRNNMVTVGNCGGMVLSFSEFLSCLGLKIQETTTLIATFTATETVTTGYTTMTVGGCTPFGFPYSRCPVLSIGTPVLPPTYLFTPIPQDTELFTPTALATESFAPTVVPTESSTSTLVATQSFTSDILGTELLITSAPTIPDLSAGIETISSIDSSAVINEQDINADDERD